MSATPAAPESKTSNDEQSFLARLTEFGDGLIAAERPAAADVGKVLGGLIHWIDKEGEYVAPEIFNPGVSEQLAEQEASQNRLAEENRSLQSRMEAMETLMKQQVAGTGSSTPTTPTSATGVDATPGEGAAPVAPAPVSTVPGVSTSTPQAPALTTPPSPAPPAAAPPVSD